MAWPTALTDDSDLKRFVFVQRLNRLLEAGNSYDELHKGAAIAIKNYLESVGGVEDVDAVQNPDSFKPASANWVVWQIFRGHADPDIKKMADDFRVQFRTEMKEITPIIAEPDGRSGGVVAEVVMIPQSDRKYFTRSRSGAIFDTRRQ